VVLLKYFNQITIFPENMPNWSWFSGSFLVFNSYKYSFIYVQGYYHRKYLNYTKTAIFAQYFAKSSVLVEYCSKTMLILPVSGFIYNFCAIFSLYIDKTTVVDKTFIIAVFVQCIKVETDNKPAGMCYKILYENKTKFEGRSQHTCHELVTASTDYHYKRSG